MEKDSTKSPGTTSDKINPPAKKISSEEKKSGPEWFESEDFWLNYSPIMFDENKWNEAPAVAECVKKIAGLKKGSTVLDAGCGLGRISVELADLELDVTGVDLIQAELDAAKEYAQAENVPLKLVKADLRSFNAPEQFDCTINLYTSFGYCDTIEEDLQILKNMAASVQKGGTLILECVSRETAILYFTQGEEFERAGFLVRTEFSVEGAWEGLKSRWTLFPQGTNLTKNPDTKPVVDHVFTQRLYSAVDLCNFIKKECGFTSAQTYGDFELSPYDQNAKTMVIVAKK
ncbi:MAG: class I SAM-dependent methyltransferase [Treponema sp.]|nr:class I SAM-dependent methyltransferase [Treponema sp.]